jgi:DNA mismatch repair protein MutL
MSCIKILSSNLRNKIAAGEVIERPASVVKELIENSIDAGSTDIQIEILYGGKHLIKVSDNGTGMDREDALLAFERHATSKLLKDDDLFNINTLGFRGEALPAIASVSKVKIITGTKGISAGTSIEINGGEIKETKDAPPYNGTSIEVRDLFFNTPARKKFLKTNTTEIYHIIDAVTRAAVSQIETGFKLTTDTKETLNISPASGLKERLIQIFGSELFNDLSEVNAQFEDIKLTAFVSDTRSFRNSKATQFIFINRRPVRDQSISHAVYSSYEGILPQGMHPVFFIFLEIDPRMVDFNVHPSKREVRFEDKETIYRFVSKHVREVIKGGQTEYTRPFTEAPLTGSSGYYNQYKTDDSFHGFPGVFAVSESLALGFRPALPHIYLGDTFIALSGKGGLTIIDHHAAHERVLFEKLLKGMSSMSRQLLFPKQVKLPPKEYNVLFNNKETLHSFGIEIDDFGQNTMIVRSIPDELENADITGILSDIAAGLIEGKFSASSLKKDIAARIACHSSVRGKEILNSEEVSRLLSDLEKTEHPDQCPHGRPTRIFYSLDDLNKLFKRK